MMNAARPPSSAGIGKRLKSPSANEIVAASVEVRAPAPILHRRGNLAHADRPGNFGRVFRELRHEQRNTCRRFDSAIAANSWAL